MTTFRARCRSARGNSVLRMCPAVAALLAVAGEANAQYSSRSFAGPQQGAGVGFNVRQIGDVNGDGFGDVLTSAPNYDGPGASDGGIAIVISGATTLALHSYTGTLPSENFGLSIAEAGDVNGDGRADFMVSSQAHDPVTGALSVVTVYSGATFLPLRFYPGNATTWYTAGVKPQSLAPAGDVDADGFVDGVIGAYLGGPISGTQYGSVHLVSGATGAVVHTWYGPQLADYFGAALSGAGDVDGDGKDDFVVGAERDFTFGSFAGSARVFRGIAPYSQVIALGASVPSEFFGEAVTSLGDITGDGRSDLVVGAFGVVRILSGATGGLISAKTGLWSSGWGSQISAAGDHDGDGKTDLLVGASTANQVGSLSGVVHLYSGASGALLRTFQGAAAGAQFGSSIDGGGDTNNDGSPDIVVGAQGAPSGQYFGAVHLFESACQTLYAYGSGCPGTGGFVPQLDVTGCVANGPGTLTLQVTKAHGGAMALLFVGISPLYYAPPSGCSLLVNPLLAPATTLPLAGVGPGNGSGSFPFTLTPSNLPIDVYLQVLTTDPKPLGYSTSNGFLIGKPGT